MNKGVKIALWVVVGLLAIFALIQLVPYGRDHTNPPVVSEYQWRSVEARAVAEKACYDCHSNETKWLWYHSIAPGSWLVQRDVDEGRGSLNFSEWPAGGAALEGAMGKEIAEVVSEGEMPPVQYKLVHGDARLSDAERQLLIDEFSQDK